MSETCAARAAKYFGLFEVPRRSVSLGRHRVAIFATDHLYIYDEQGWPPMAVSVALTDARREALMIELERGMATV